MVDTAPLRSVEGCVLFWCGGGSNACGHGLQAASSSPFLCLYVTVICSPSFANQPSALLVHGSRKACTILA